MRKQGRIEINAVEAIARPLNPRIKMPWLNAVTVDRLAFEVAVGGVEVESVGTWNQAERFVQIGSQFFEGPRAPRMIAGDGNPTGEGVPGGLKAGDIITLPALDRDGDSRECAESGFRVDAERGKGFLRGLVGSGVLCEGGSRGEPLLANFAGRLQRGLGHLWRYRSKLELVKGKCGEGRWAHEDAKARRRGERDGEGCAGGLGGGRGDGHTKTRRHEEEGRERERGRGEALVVKGRAVSRSFLFVSLCLRVSLHQGALRQRRGRLFDDVSTVTMNVFVKPL